MRLIDADELRKQLSTICPLYATDEYDYCTKDILDKVDDLVQKQPTAYDLDKAVERLETNTEIAYKRYMDCNSDTPAVEYAIRGTQYQERRKCLELVKSGGIE